MCPPLPPQDAARVGMDLAEVARAYPDRLAIISRYRDRTFAELNARANQFARALRARGLGEGDAVALVCANRPEFAVVVYGALRAGLRLTPISCHGTAEETARVIGHCDAKALVVDAAYAAPAMLGVRRMRAAGTRPDALLAIGELIPGFEDWEDALDAEDDRDLDDPVLGSRLVYTSGTTGNAKGVHLAPHIIDDHAGFPEVSKLAGYVGGSDLHLCTGPLYHNSNLLLSLMMPLRFGCGVVMMYRFSATRALEMIDGYGVTHTHMVPAMLRQLLALPRDVRSGYSARSLRMLLHGAAPCPRSEKQALIEWFGPILCEYYAAAEGFGCVATSEEWLARPGTVGRPCEGRVEVRDDGGAVLGAGQSGTIHLRVDPEFAFSYHKEPELTEATLAENFVTLGDIGSLDDDGYLFIHDRASDTIHRDGLPVYPAEVDAVLVAHPAVREVATFGVAHPERGEEVVSVVALHDGEVGSERLRADIDHFCRAHLPAEKRPGRIDFADELPQRETGEMLRRVLRDSYKVGAVSLPISSD